ncbi:MAG: hypothetical protein M3Z03_06975, partial [Actinomycetota bacterium]|nr:hypothetical protein [Actinomycetota bacterium]
MRRTTLTHRRRAASLLVALALITLVAACGQKPGVHNAAKDELPQIILESGAGAGGPAVAGEGGEVVGGDGVVT